jgi:hypothetical protein
MASRTQALNPPQSVPAAVPDAAALPATPPNTDTSLPILQIAINLVFGTPFLACLFVARSKIAWVYRIPEIGGYGFVPYVWTMTAALGALWLGVSLALHPVRARRPAGAFLMLAGTALIVLLNSFS